LPQEFYAALKIRDSLKNISGIVMSKIHLAEYYAKYKDTLKAIDYAYEANQLASSVKNNRDRLISLFLLSKIDRSNAKNNLNDYIALSDSLNIEERKLRNKFTRIRFETDEYIEETQELSKQKMWITIIGLSLISIISLLYYIKRQQARNRELIFEKEQQRSNEEIYALMLKHQAKLEEGRMQERNRISEDLHDGILGNLFGTRMGFGFLDLKGDQDTLKKYNSYLEEMQQIEKEIRSISHELKSEILSSKFNFIDILDDLIRNQAEAGFFKYKLHSTEAVNWEKFDEKIKIDLYRIIQEAIQNISKYAKATKVNIVFDIIDNKLRLTIEDNGIGFNVKEKSKGIGLKNMRSRTQKYNGDLTIRSVTNEGTIINITVPV
jgi:signal transduction histidine kinase